MESLESLHLTNSIASSLKQQLNEDQLIQLIADISNQNDFVIPNWWNKIHLMNNHGMDSTEVDRFVDFVLSTNGGSDSLRLRTDNMMESFVEWWRESFDIDGNYIDD